MNRNSYFRTHQLVMALGLGVLLLLAQNRLRAVVAAPDVPPKMPTFDRVTVQCMLAHVEENENASLLKIGYFTGHRSPIFPVADGYVLLKDDLAKAKPESRRWFVLRSLQVWAGIHMGLSTRIEALDDYAQLCGRVTAADRAGASGILRQTIHDFVDEAQMSYLQGKNIDSKVKEKTQRDLVKSFVAYWAGLERGQSDEETPAWDDAVEATGFQLWYAPSDPEELSSPAKPKGVVDLIESDLRTPRFADNYWMLKNAALFFSHSTPNRSVELLQRARRVVPSQNAVETQWVLGKLVDTLESEHKFPDAVRVQTSIIKRTGRGRAKLLCLYAENYSKDAYKSTLTTLSTPGADEQDINDAVDLMLNSKPMKHSYGDTTNDAKNLLTNYLTAKRHRSVEQELIARIALSGILVDEDELSEAKSVLAVTNIQAPPPNSDAGLLYEEAQRLQAQINQKLAAPAG